MQKACHFFLGYKPSRVVLFFSPSWLCCVQSKKKNKTNKQKKTLIIDYQYPSPVYQEKYPNSKKHACLFGSSPKTYDNLYEKHLLSFCGHCD